mmetsp:Transcript_57647/g.187288  ORF Transcript_57647/g.187288 Transcript_57647/m.187288 type:complete len:497 (-) Transcript_57647:81-1571(-)
MLRMRIGCRSQTACPVATPHQHSTGLIDGGRQVTTACRCSGGSSCGKLRRLACTLRLSLRLRVRGVGVADDQRLRHPIRRRPIQIFHDPLRLLDVAHSHEGDGVAVHARGLQNLHRGHVSVLGEHQLHSAVVDAGRQPLDVEVVGGVGPEPCIISATAGRGAAAATATLALEGLDAGGLRGGHRQQALAQLALVSIRWRRRRGEACADAERRGLEGQGAVAGLASGGFLCLAHLELATTDLEVVHGGDRVIRLINRPKPDEAVLVRRFGTCHEPDGEDGAESLEQLPERPLVDDVGNASHVHVRVAHREVRLRLVGRHRRRGHRGRLGASADAHARRRHPLQHVVPIHLAVVRSRAGLRRSRCRSLNRVGGGVRAARGNGRPAALGTVVGDLHVDLETVQLEVVHHRYALIAFLHRGVAHKAVGSLRARLVWSDRAGDDAPEGLKQGLEVIVANGGRQPRNVEIVRHPAAPPQPPPPPSPPPPRSAPPVQPPPGPP